jgi:N-acylneuraminate cytidylyltransferase
MVIWGLIPARAGSKRIHRKNIKRLNGKPLIHWTIMAAQDSQIFEKIIISTDDHELMCMYRDMEYHQRPKELAQDNSTDYEWIKHLFMKYEPLLPNCFAMLRPTSPFRTAQDIQIAWNIFQNYPYADSLRAVKPSKEHPGKMWITKEDYILPLMNYGFFNDQYSYNSPTQLLPKYYIQCGALEISYTRNVLFRRNVSGYRIIPYFMDEINGFDVNTSLDFLFAEMLIEKGIVRL